MLLDSFFRYLDSQAPCTRSRRRAARTRSVLRRLFLEPLEDRALPSFLAPRAFDVGIESRSVAMGDFNGDRNFDLAVANGGSDDVSVLLGRGDGAFRPARNFPVGREPVSVAAGDFNGDDRDDLAVANRAGNNVSILLSNGDGTFQAARNFAAGLGPRSVAVGDFSGDGRLDLAVAGFYCDEKLCYDENARVLLGTGDGSFQAPRTFPTWSGPTSVAVGDVNGDRRPDLAVANVFTNDVSVLLGNGDGSFQPRRYYGAGDSPRSVALGDVNGDGRPDLAVVNSAEFGMSPSVGVLLGNGDGTFQAARHFPTENLPWSMAIGEFNGDGRLDLAVAYRISDEVSVHLGNGDGTFRPARFFSAGGSPRSVAVGDVSNDGRLDLAVTNYVGNTVSVLLGNADGSFQATQNFPAGRSPLSVAAGDVNGDGRLDLAIANYFSANVSVLLGNGDGTFQAARHFPAGGSFSVAVGDINNDGRPDLAAATNAGVSVLLGNGDGSFQAARNFPAGNKPFSVAVRDVNADGLPDLAVANWGTCCEYNDGSVSLLVGNGDGTFQAARNFPAGRVPYSVVVGDVNGDGRPDLAVANYFSANVSVLLGNGDGTFRAAQNFPAGSRLRSVAVGDVNGDGRLDLATANYGTCCPVRDSSVSVLLGNGDGSFQAAQNFPAGIFPRSMALGDVNNDGRLDLVVTGGAVRVLLGNGDGTFQTTNISYVAGVSPISLAAADFDDDGWPDLAVANRVSNDVSILLNAADDAALFYLDAPASVPAGQRFDLTVYALSGDWQRLAHGYRGTVAFWSSDAQATLPAPYTFRPENYGIATFPGGVTLRTPGTQYLAAFDLATFTIIGYAVVEVLGTAPGGGGDGANSGTADFALARVCFDFVTWARPRRWVWAPGASPLP